MTGRDRHRSTVRFRTVGASTPLEDVSTRGLVVASGLVVALHVGVLTLAWAATVFGGDTLIAASVGAAIALALRRLTDRVRSARRPRRDPA